MKKLVARHRFLPLIPLPDFLSGNARETATGVGKRPGSTGRIDRRPPSCRRSVRARRNHSRVAGSRARPRGSPGRVITPNRPPMAQSRRGTAHRQHPDPGGGARVRRLDASPATVGGPRPFRRLADSSFMAPSQAAFYRRASSLPTPLTASQSSIPVCFVSGPPATRRGTRIRRCSGSGFGGSP